MKKIDLFLINVSRAIPAIIEDELSYYEVLARVKTRMNDVVNSLNSTIDEVLKRDTIVNVDKKITILSDSISNNRKLSDTGNFTGSINGIKVSRIIEDLASSIGLTTSMINMINARESIGGVYSGGTFTTTGTPTRIISGGGF